MNRSGFVLMLSVAVILLIAGPAHAKNAARSYSIKCAGEDDLQRLAGLAGIIKFTDATHALGTVFLNISDGTIVTQQSFTATVVNGTAAADGTGGNSIPTGCFTAAITIGGGHFRRLRRTLRLLQQEQGRIQRGPEFGSADYLRG